MKILISAFSCEPDGASEQDVGWNWAIRAAQHHEVWVITNTFAREKILRELEERPVPNLHFVFHRVPLGGLAFSLPAFLYSMHYAGYLAWQYTALKVARRLHEQVKFDVAHHLTWATHRFPTFLAWLDVPYVWGPVGGGERAPLSFYRGLGVRTFVSELARDLSNFVVRFDPFVRRTAERAALILATTEETRQALPKVGTAKSSVFPAIALDCEELDRVVGSREVTDDSQQLRLLFVGRLKSWKGSGIALRTLAELRHRGIDATLTFIGQGPDGKSLRSQAAELAVSDFVEFAGAVPRARVLQKFREHDVFLFPSMHDSGGIAVLEAMYLGLPVVCLDLGGPARSVGDAGIRVQCHRPSQVINDLADAIEGLQSNPAHRERLREAARARIEQYYDWDSRTESIDQVYRSVVASVPTFAK